MRWQDSFANALRDPDTPLPEGVTGKSGADIARRFNVYRNNVHATLTGALKDNFPVVMRLVGEEFFRAMAGVFSRARMPQTPVLALYGDGFANLIDGFAPASSLPYLADMARLEYARQEAFCAADATVLDRRILAEIDVAGLLGQRVQLHPSLRLIASRYPIYAIWRKNTDTPEMDIPNQHESILISRREAEVDTIPLPVGGAIFFNALIHGATLGNAASMAVDNGGGDHLDELMVLAIGHATSLERATDLEGATDLERKGKKP